MARDREKEELLEKLEEMRNVHADQIRDLEEQLADAKRCSDHENKKHQLHVERLTASSQKKSKQIEMLVSLPALFSHVHLAVAESGCVQVPRPVQGGSAVAGADRFKTNLL